MLVIDLWAPPLALSHEGGCKSSGKVQALALSHAMRGEGTIFVRVVEASPRRCQGFDWRSRGRGDGAVAALVILFSYKIQPSPVSVWSGGRQTIWFRNLVAEAGLRRCSFGDRAAVNSITDYRGDGAAAASERPGRSTVSSAGRGHGPGFWASRRFTMDRAFSREACGSKANRGSTRRGVVMGTCPFYADKGLSELAASMGIKVRTMLRGNAPRANVGRSAATR